MEALAPNFRLAHLLPRTLSVAARERARREVRWLTWREHVAGFVNAHGLRGELIHVDEGQWARAYLAGKGPAEAVSEAAERLH